MQEFLKYKDKIEKSLLKKAFGYRYNEVIEEYSVAEDGEKLIKRKVTTKDVPPDISAVKLLLEALDIDKAQNLEELTDEELKAEIKKAMDYIEKQHIGEKNGTVLSLISKKYNTFHCNFYEIRRNDSICPFNINISDTNPNKSLVCSNSSIFIVPAYCCEICFCNAYIRT